MSQAGDFTIAEVILTLLPNSERDRSIIYKRVFCSATLDQLKKRYQISNQRIWQIEKKFLISTLSHIYNNPKNAIRVALDTPVNEDKFSIMSWYENIGAELIGEFPKADRMFKGRCVFECFLLLLKKIYSISGYDYWKPNLQEQIADFLSTYQVYYQASPIRAYNALGDVSAYVWRFTKNNGMVYVDYVSRRLQAAREITSKALQMDGYVEFSDGWYLHKNVLFDQRSIFNLSLIKIFNVADIISIQDIYEGLYQSLQWEILSEKEIKPDIGLLKLSLIGYGFTIEDNVVHWKKSHNNPNALSKAEQSIMKCAMLHGPVFSSNEMKKCLNNDGISASNIWNNLVGKSPIILRISENKDCPRLHRIIGSNPISSRKRGLSTKRLVEGR